MALLKSANHLSLKKPSTMAAPSRSMTSMRSSMLQLRVGERPQAFSFPRANYRYVTPSKHVDQKFQCCLL